MTDERKSAVGVELKHRLYRIAQALRREASSSPLTTAQAAVLSLLMQEGRMRVSDLAKSEAVALPTMSQVVNRMVEASWVQRENPRGTYNNFVTITRKGRSLAAKVAKQRDLQIAARMKDLTPGQLAVLEKAIPILDQMYDREPWKISEAEQ